MNLWLLFSLVAAAGVFMGLEFRGAPLTLKLSFKGDLKRESQWLAQFGQFVATAVAMALVWAFEPGEPKKMIALGVTVLGTSIITNVLKKLFGRVRPNRENAGRFTGPTLKRDNARESFPSSHSSCAIALAVGLSILYPQAMLVFGTLGWITAILRYLMDAHWPSDVLAGIAIGYLLANVFMGLFGYHA